MATVITMDTSTDYMSALKLPFGEFFEFYDTIDYVNTVRKEEMDKEIELQKNGKE